MRLWGGVGCAVFKHRRYPISAPILDGLIVLDLSRVLAGPWATQTLSDLGATVVKVEHPKGGDDTRKFGPPFHDNDLSAYFISANRGKQSICIDISRPEGAELVKQLAAKADVLVENFKFGDLENKGLGYDALASLNPTLIYCSITGFGQTGPARANPGYDMVVQGMAGLMSITGAANGEPQKVGVALADIMTGLYSTIAILAALNDRTQSGKGQHIDMALMDVVTASLANQASNFLVSGQVPERMGNEHPNIVPYQVFEVSDGHLIVAVANDNQFLKFMAIIERDDLARDDRFDSNAGRVQYRAILIPELANTLKTKSLNTWLQLFDNSGVPVSPINTIDRVFDDEQVKSRQLQVESEGVPMVSNPIRFSRSELSKVARPPYLGEHDDLLTKLLDLTKNDIDALKQKNIIGKQS